MLPFNIKWCCYYRYVLLVCLLASLMRMVIGEVTRDWGGVIDDINPGTLNLIEPLTVPSPLSILPPYLRSTTA